MSDRRDIAVLGATGHVGKVLAEGLAPEHVLTLYARRPAVVSQFTAAEGIVATTLPLEALGTVRHDAIVNCIGVGNPAEVAADPARVYEVTNRADDLALGYLGAHPECRLVNFSSGAAYCSQFDAPADETTPAALCAGAIRPDQHYGLAKLASEGRHRALTEFAIVDLRLFSLFSRHIDPSAGFLMNDVLRCIRETSTLVTGPWDHTRDYVAPHDLCALVAACVVGDAVNAAFDVTSAAPVAKFDLLAAFRERFGLAYTVEEVFAATGATGSKPAYYSLSRKARSLGYTPTKTSLETLVEESEALLSTTR